MLAVLEFRLQPAQHSALLLLDAFDYVTAIVICSAQLQEEEKLKRDVMRHMLFRQKALPDVPVPRNDLTKLILASYKDTKRGNMGNAVIALAQESFPKTMGMEMKELRVAPVSKGKSKLAGEVSPCTSWLEFGIIISSWPAVHDWLHKFQQLNCCHANCPCKHAYPHFQHIEQKCEDAVQGHTVQCS